MAEIGPIINKLKLIKNLFTPKTPRQTEFYEPNSYNRVDPVEAQKYGIEEATKRAIMRRQGDGRK